MTGTLSRFHREGMTFEVVDRGVAEHGTVVLLHGFPQTATCWELVTPVLNARGLRTLAPNQRGYSPQARPRWRTAYRTGQLVDDVVALIDQAGDGPVHLVGHDWGAAVAWGVAAGYPDRVRTLTAVSVGHPAAFLQSMVRSDQLKRSWYMGAFQLPFLPELLLSDPERVKASLAATGMTADGIREVQRGVIDAGALTGGLNWYRAMPLSAPSALRRKVRVPTTMVAGGEDTALSVRGAELSTGFVDAPFELEILPDAGHWIPDQQPELLTDLILARIGLPA